MRTVVIAWFLVMLTGCAAGKGFDRSTLRDSLRQVTTGPDSREVPGLRPQLPAPFKLGIYLNSDGSSDKNRSWTEEEKNDLLTYGNQLKEAGIVSHVYFISNDDVPDHHSTGAVDATNGETLDDLRSGAARYGADALLVITDVSSVDRYNNASALLYCTIVGAYLVPGTHSDALVMMRSSLWDVRTGYLYATQDAEGFSRRTGPALMTHDVDSVYGAKKMAIADFGKKLTDRLIQLNAHMR